MKKILFIFISSVLVVATLVGCTNKADSDAGKLNVMASFYPMADFAQKVGGNKVKVTNMVPSGSEPHDWEPSATDIKNLEKADVFVYNGAGMEHWVSSVLKSLDNNKLIKVEASKGITLLKGKAHTHDDEEHVDDDEEENEIDPHVWLNPLNAKAEMKNIKDALVKADKKNKSYYEKNYQKYAAKFDKLDKKYRESLANTKSKKVIVAHEAFGYLCNAYGLTQVGIEGLSADSEPSAERMKEIVAFAKANNIKTIFFEELVSPKVAKAIAKEVGAKTKVLNPLEGLSKSDIKKGKDYFSVMETNLSSLVAALNE